MESAHQIRPHVARSDEAILDSMSRGEERVRPEMAGDLRVGGWDGQVGEVSQAEMEQQFYQGFLCG